MRNMAAAAAAAVASAPSYPEMTAQSTPWLSSSSTIDTQAPFIAGLQHSNPLQHNAVALQHHFLAEENERSSNSLAALRMKAREHSTQHIVSPAHLKYHLWHSNKLQV